MSINIFNFQCGQIYGNKSRECSYNQTKEVSLSFVMPSQHHKTQPDFPREKMPVLEKER